MSVDPRVTEFRDAVVRALQAREAELDIDDTSGVPLMKLTTAWCQERANQLAVIFQGALAEGPACQPIDESGGGEDPGCNNHKGR